MKRNKTRVNGFGLGSVVIIIIITAIVSSLATGVITISNQNNDTYKSNYTTNDKDLKNFVELYDTILSKYYDTIDREGMLKAAEEGMLNYLGDKYTTILSDDEYKGLLESLQSEYKGIGVTIENNIIKEITANSPAEKAGLKAGDVIVTINNTNVENSSSKVISSMIKDNDLKTVSLVVRRDDSLMNFTVNKANLIYPYVSSNIIDNTNIGYMSITAFSENLTEQVKNELKSLENKGMTGLIIDLRNNGGGYLNAATDTASLFLEKGLTIYSLSNTSSTETIKDETDEHRSYPIVVLVNKQSASASEILAAALKQSYNATLVGTQTYGKGKVQQVSSLKTGETVKFTTAEWLTPNGVCIDGVGLSVDYNIELKYNYNESGEIIGFEDTQLNKAIELLK